MPLFVILHFFSLLVALPICFDRSVEIRQLLSIKFMKFKEDPLLIPTLFNFPFSDFTATVGPQSKQASVEFRAKSSSKGHTPTEIGSCSLCSLVIHTCSRSPAAVPETRGRNDF